MRFYRDMFGFPNEDHLTGKRCVALATHGPDHQGLAGLLGFLAEHPMPRALAVLPEVRPDLIEKFLHHYFIDKVEVKKKGKESTLKPRYSSKVSLPPAAQPCWPARLRHA